MLKRLLGISVILILFVACGGEENIKPTPKEVLVVATPEPTPEPTPTFTAMQKPIESNRLVKNVTCYFHRIDLILSEKPTSTYCATFKKITYYFSEVLFFEIENDLNNAIKLNPKNSDAYMMRAYFYHHYGESLEDMYNAIDDLTMVIKLNPKSVNAYLDRADMYLYLSRYERAIDDYNDAIKLNPQSAEAYLRRGSSYWWSGLNKEALKDYSKVIDLNQNKCQKYFPDRLFSDFIDGDKVGKKVFYHDISCTQLGINNRTSILEAHPELKP